MANDKLYDELLKQLQDTTTYTNYINSFKWVNYHLGRLSISFDFLDLGKPIKFEIDGVVRVAKFKRFIVTTHFIGLETGYGNIWYYEAEKPTDKELEDFKKDGHCLIISE